MAYDDEPGSVDPKRYLKIDGGATISDLWQRVSASRRSSAVLDVKNFRYGDPYHDRLVRDYDELDRYYVDAAMPFYEDTMDNYDLYLADAPDKRSKDELWRANIFVPLPGSNVEAKVAAEVNTITKADPLIQIEGVQDADREGAKDIEHLLDYTHRMNAFRRFFIKSRRAVAIQGTDFVKPIWTVRGHWVRVWTSQDEKDDFLKYLEEATMAGAPTPPDIASDPEGFEEWRTLINQAKKTSRPIPEYPLDGNRYICTFKGPELIRLPLHSVHLDPMTDEMKDQDRVFYRTLVPLEWVLERTGDEPDKPFRVEQVEKAMNGWDGEDLERYEREVSRKLGFNVQERQHKDPFFQHAVELVEVFDQNPSSPVKYGIMLNRKTIINKDCFEFPSWSGECLISPFRNMQLPGHFFGLSDYKWPKSLYKELNTLRNLRVDGVTLNVLPVYTSLMDAGLPELIRKISPGAILTVKRHDAIRALEKASLPAEAYREPSEIKAEIADAHGIEILKGKEALVGRVTGVEFSGRVENAQLRILMGCAAFEEEYQPVLRHMVAFYAQNYRKELKMRFGGRLLSFSRTELIESIGQNFRFRGVTQALDRNLQAQQLMMVAEKFAAQLPPPAAFRLMRLILEALNVRGLESIITPEEEQAISQGAAGAAGAAGQTSQAAGDAALEQGVDVAGAGAPGAAAVPPPGPAAPQG